MSYDSRYSFCALINSLKMSLLSSLVEIELPEANVRAVIVYGRNASKNELDLKPVKERVFETIEVVSLTKFSSKLSVFPEQTSSDHVVD